jgi:hypothetical protein
MSIAALRGRSLHMRVYRRHIAAAGEDRGAETSGMALDAASANGWTVVDMKNDWN